ncbi:muts domain V-domain-containing protein [Umbelopsis sp. PMI_123]|nr:muts domain V-domain-containing protein [Umbelopsis sp. PMI_123]
MALDSPKEIPELDKPEQQNFVKFFRSLPEKEEGTIYLFERDANQRRYYTLHGEDAVYIAQAVYKTTSAIKYWGGAAPKGLATTSLTHSAAESFLRDALLNKQLRIEIWAPKKGTSQWSVIRKASPGNLQDVEDYLFLNSNLTSAPVVMAVKLATTTEHKIVGVSFADASIREIGVSEFVDNELYSNFESLLIQLGVKECIIPQDDAHKDYELIKLKGVLSRCNVVATERKRSDFNTKDIEQDLNRLLDGEISVAALPEFEMKNAMASCACLVKYLSILSDETAFGKYTLKHHDLSQYMRLDASALRALNLMPSPHDGASKTMSLFGLLNKCKTAQGSRLLGQWLKQPLLDIDNIRERQDLVQIFAEDTEIRQSVQEDHLKNVPDMHRLAKRFQRGFASLQDAVRIYQVIIKLPGLQACLEGYTGDDDFKSLIDRVYISKLKEHAKDLEKLQEMVETTIDLEAIADHEFIIKADFDEDLLDLRQQINDARARMDKEHLKLADKLRLDADKKLKLEKHNIYGYCFRISRADSGAIRNKSEFIEYATQKAGTYFATTTLKELNNTWMDHTNQYEKKQNSLVKEVIGIVATYCPIMESLGSLIAHLDVIVSFAHVSVMAPIPYVRPTLHPIGEGNVLLEEARHPCLEVQDDVAFIPNDVKLVRDESEFQIITGPNMGGKSTYIRQIGVIALMAQIGCFVPCSEATLTIFDSILARVGAGDSQLKGVSTFMAEMLETATILQSATSKSLIIIDELGRGTSTYDGFGLAWAISEYIATKIKAFCLFATHFHELTALNEKVPHVRNLNVAVHVGDTKDGGIRDITLLYKVNEGVCDQSFGIHVAELARFPSTVVRLAKRKADELEDTAIAGHDEPVTKFTKMEVSQGNDIVQHCLREFGSEDIENMDEQALSQRLEGIRSKYSREIEQNAYLRDLLA